MSKVHEYLGKSLGDDAESQYPTKCLTIRLDIDDYLYLEGLASLANKTKSGFAAGIVKSTISDALSYLSPNDQEKIVRDVDMQLRHLGLS